VIKAKTVTVAMKLLKICADQNSDLTARNAFILDPLFPLPRLPNLSLLLNLVLRLK
jgi:hypothetical protein